MIILPEQASLLHLRVRFGSPSHFAPSLEGGGLLHSRYLVRIPPPQVCEQDDHLPKGPHCPSTATNKKCEYYG